MSDTPKGSKIARLADEKVGSNIRLRRTMLGLTQEQLAQALNISYQQVQKYETGANRISAGRLYEIAKFLNVEIGSFFDGLQPTAESQPLPHGGRNRPTIELVKNFSEIQDAAVRGAVSNLVRTLTHCSVEPEAVTDVFEAQKEAS
ncbi:MAG: XRE family transcriptional regulator [Alphaproteobacteria bacterium]|nr:MAG: XRE family transcriptional regulator [Alphaproteobacteria bacterium]